MKSWARTLLLCLAASAVIDGCFAQGGSMSGRAAASFGQTTAGPAGSVTGTVIDQDTQRPVRLAFVSLQPVDANTQSNTINNGRQGFMMRGGGQRTGLDGNFLIEGVAPGDYYVTASAQGFVAEQSLLAAQIAAGARVDDVLHEVPTVHVSTNGVASVVVSLQHGGAIGGHVEWQDGSPANGVQMSAQPVITPAPVAGLPRFAGATFGRDNQVDDRGSFRLSGLTPGDYILSATVTPEFSRSGPSYPIRIYAPGVFRRTEATPISVRAGEERNDVRMVLRLNDLRTVSGNVGAASGSASVKSGSVALVDSLDPTLRVGGRIASDGSFSVKFVPPGTYTMTVQGSSQEAQSGYRRGGGSATSGDAVTAFAPLTQPLTVGSTDVSGMAINLATQAAH
jgi:hypothetical protein